LNAWNLAISAAATLSIREGAAGGTIVAQKVFTAAGDWNHTVGGEGIRCKTTGTNRYFVENSAGNITGASDSDRCDCGWDR
jgi:hypothetical protein